MTKTENYILAKINKHGTFCTNNYYGQGSKGGNVSGGQREAKTVRKMLKSGILEIVREDRSTICDSGYSIHITMTMVKLATK